MNPSFALPMPHRLPPHEQHRRLDTATQHLSAPVAVIDAQALASNAQQLVARAHGKPVRLASKSIRSAGVLASLLNTPGFHGVLAFSLPEAIMLVEHGITDDVVVAYPTVNIGALATLVSSAKLLNAVTLMVDHPDHLKRIADAGTAQQPVRVCLDVNLALTLGPFHIGARRSPLATVQHVTQAATAITANPGLRLVGLMGYESHIAGIPDRRFMVRTMKRLAVPQARARRQHLTHAVEQVLAQRGMPPLEFVNGGGTGSMETTAADDSVTEIGAGSGLYGPHLFDEFTTFTPAPAVFFGLDVVRLPSANTVTVHGGGWVASGPPGADRLPQPVYPPGLKFTATEGAGEVQTPLRVPAGLPSPSIGQRIWFRHAKAGEIAEHVNHFTILMPDGLTTSVQTYRGAGYAL